MLPAQLSDNQNTFHRNIPGFNILMRILITDAAMTINNNYVAAPARTKAEEFSSPRTKKRVLTGLVLAACV